MARSQLKFWRARAAIVQKLGWRVQGFTQSTSVAKYHVDIITNVFRFSYTVNVVLK